jgi:hypothetical protein
MWAVIQKISAVLIGKIFRYDILGCAAVHSERDTEGLEESTANFFCRYL